MAALAVNYAVPAESLYCGAKARLQKARGIHDKHARHAAGQVTVGKPVARHARSLVCLLITDPLDF